jgi:flagellum-specific ATP synthase
VGAYEAGSDAVLDVAIAKHDDIEAFLQQDIHQPATVSDSIEALAHLLT